MILHTVNKPPQHGQALQLCLRFAGPDDIILLIEDGVTAAIAGTEASKQLIAAGSGRVIALQEDLVTRGLGDKIDPGIAVTDYAGFVALCCDSAKIQSWF